MTTQLQAILRELRTRFERLYGERLVHMVLYGSQARGDAEPGSDIDMLVVLRGEVEPCAEIAATEFDVADLSLEHDVSIVCVFVSEEEYRGGGSPLMLNVRREGVAV
jgi:predicted nucleotidyltransferase